MKRITQPPKQRYRFTYNYAKPFEQHRGRRLKKYERAIIYALEKARIQSRIPRFLIIDRGETNTKPILLEYLQWRARDGIVVHPRKVRDAPYKSFSSHAPDNLRGHTYSHALLVDTHLHADGARRSLRIIAGTVPLQPGSLVIIHTRCRIPLPEAFREPDPPPDIGITDATGPPLIIELQHEVPTNQKCTEVPSARINEPPLSPKRRPTR